MYPPAVMGRDTQQLLSSYRMSVGRWKEARLESLKDLNVNPGPSALSLALCFSASQISHLYLPVNNISLPGLL